MTDLNDRLTRVFKGPGYNPYRAQCGQFTSEGNAGGECSGDSSGSASNTPSVGEMREKHGFTSKDIKAVEVTNDLKTEGFKPMPKAEALAEAKKAAALVEQKMAAKYLRGPVESYYPGINFKEGKATSEIFAGVGARKNGPSPKEVASILNSNGYTAYAVDDENFRGAVFGPSKKKK